MTAPTSKNAPHLGAEPSYGPTHAAPDDGASQPASTSATDADREVYPCQHSHGPSDRSPASPGSAHHPAGALDRPPEMLTVREAAALLRIGRNQLYQAIANGEIPALRIGRSIRIPTQALADLITGGSPGDGERR